MVLRQSQDIPLGKGVDGGKATDPASELVDETDLGICAVIGKPPDARPQSMTRRVGDPSPKSVRCAVLVDEPAKVPPSLVHQDPI
jgi:hypothetical protein